MKDDAHEVQGDITIRGFRVGPYRRQEAGVLAVRKTHFECQFSNGLRVPSDDPCEWDYRCVDTAEEARAAAIYEYAREVEWVYDHRAEMLSRESFAGSEIELENAFAELGQKWLSVPSFGNHSVFPIPWTCLPEGIRRNPCTVIRWVVRELEPRTFCESQTRTSGTPFRRHVLEIDWSQDRRIIEAELLRWMTRRRLKDVQGMTVGRPRGRRSPFTKLKELAAYRMAKAGLRWEEAKMRVRELHPQSPVLPCYPTEPNWCRATAGAQKEIAKSFPDPRLFPRNSHPFKWK